MVWWLFPSHIDLVQLSCWTPALGVAEAVGISEEFMAARVSCDPLCHSVLERGYGWNEIKDVQGVAGGAVGYTVWIMVCVCLQQVQL